MGVPRSKGRMMRARIWMPCRFCGYGEAVGELIKLSHKGDWLHPHCANYEDAGKTLEQMQFDWRLRQSIRRINEAKKEEQQRQPVRSHCEDYF